MEFSQWPDLESSEAHEPPSTSTGGGKKKKSGLKVTDQNDNLEGGSQAEILNQILAENDRLNKIVADLSKKLKDSAATNAVQAKENENLKEANRILEQDKLRMTELESKVARVEKEKSDMEKTLAMLQVRFSFFKADDLIKKKPFMKQSFFWEHQTFLVAIVMLVMQNFSP